MEGVKWTPVAPVSHRVRLDVDDDQLEESEEDEHDREDEHWEELHTSDTMVGARMVLGFNDREGVLQLHQDQVNAGEEDVEGELLRGIAFVLHSLTVDVHSEARAKDEELHEQDTA